MSKRFLLTIATLLFIGLAASLAIFFAKGYTFSPKEKRIVGTGIISISSEPDSASVYLDGHLTTATNTTIPSLTPKTYQVKIIKEGFIPWEKSVEVREGLVSEVKTTLFPAIPTIYPLTFTGVANPVLSSDGSKLAYLVTSGKKAGVWVWGMGKNQQLSFARNSEPRQIASSATLDFSKADLRWSPDSKQVLATLTDATYLLDSDRLNTEPRDITAILEPTLKSWDEDTQTRDDARIDAVRDLNARKVASDSAFVIWSPDETKFIARKDPLPQLPDKDSKEKTISDMKVYDLGEGEKVFGAAKDYTLPPAKAYFWLPDSKHIILVEDTTISIVDFDGTNKAVIFAGSFLDNFVFPWPDSSRLVIISSLPTPTASEPNFYGINLK